MGAWGPAIFSNDTAVDVKEDFKKYVGDGLTADDATNKLLKDYQPEGDDLELYCPFWLGLAAVQVQTGRLIDLVKTEALKIIDEGLDLSLWEDNDDRKKRKAVLVKLKEQVSGPQKKETKIKRKYISTCDWSVGTIVSYELTNGEYVFISSDAGGDHPEIEILDWKGKVIPNSDVIEKLDVMNYEAALGGSRLLVCRSSKREFPVSRLSAVKAGSGEELPWSPPVVSAWRYLDEDLDKLYGLR